MRDMAHTNGIESFWSMLKPPIKARSTRSARMHLDRYVTEFAGRHNVRESDTINQMRNLAAGGVGKRLMYRDLIAGNGLASGARSQ